MGSTAYLVIELATDRQWVVLRANSDLHAITKIHRQGHPDIPLDREAYYIESFGTTVDVIAVNEEAAK